MFCYHCLERFEIARSKLPSGSIVLNQPKTLLYFYKKQIYLAGSIMAVLFALVVILFMVVVHCRRAEQKIRHLAMVVEQAGEGIALANLDGVVEYVNNAWLVMHGYEDDRGLIGKHLSVFHTEEQMEMDVTPFNDTAKDKDYHTGQVRHKRKDGTNFTAEMITTVFKDEKGCPTGLIGFAVDITERKQMEDALRESEQKFRSFVEPSTDVIFRIGTDGRFEYFNPRAIQIYGYGPGELIGKDATFLTPPEEVDVIKSSIKKNLAGEVTSNLQVNQLSKAGKLIPMEINAIPLEKDGRVVGIQGIARDITERKQAQRKLQKAHDELEIRVQQRTAKLQSEITEREKIERKLRDYQKNLQSLASELLLAEEQLRRQIAVNVHDNVGQNLAISKIKMESLAGMLPSSSKEGKIMKEIVDLTNQVIESTRSLTFELSPPILYELGFEAAIKWLLRQISKGEDFSVRFEDDEQYKPLDDNVRVFLFQTVRELLVNVVKHAQAKRVKVEIRRDGGSIFVVVEDDGVGFDAFKAKSNSHDSRGFGLFSIQERFRYIGGSVDIESEPGGGTKITLVAPIVGGDKEE